MPTRVRHLPDWLICGLGHLSPRFGDKFAQAVFGKSTGVYLIIDNKGWCAVNAERAGQCLCAVYGLEMAASAARDLTASTSTPLFQRALQQGRINTATAAHQFGMIGQKF